MVNDPDYDPLIADNINASRFLQIKSTVKLNNNLTTPKKGEEGYDPASKYDYMFKVLCHNMNYVTEVADSDAAADESSWGFSGYCGDAGGRLIGKPKDKGECLVYGCSAKTQLVVLTPWSSS